MRTAALRPFNEVEEVKPDLRSASCGRPGLSCTLWWADDPSAEPPQRSLIEQFAAKHPEAEVTLPPYQRNEDDVSGSLTWAGCHVEVGYELILPYLRIWSEKREAVVGVRQALICAAS